MKGESRRFVICALFFLTILTDSQAQAAQVQLAWDAPTTNVDGTPLTDLAGYRLYYGQTSGNYQSFVDIGNQTTYTLAGLQPGQTYYFAVTAYDTSGTQSAFSNEVSYTTDITVPPTPPMAPTSGAAPLTVTFGDASTGTVTAWAWTFGDGGTSTAQNPSYTYTKVGTYRVSLTVTGPGGSNTQTKTNYIIASPTGLVAAYGFE